MAAIWRGTVSFGLVSIPVKLHSATEERGVSFRQVHEADGGRIRFKRVCSVDGEEVAYADIAKGYELPDGDVVVLTDEDLAALPLPSRHAIEVLQFVPAEQIDGLYFSKGYYLAAEGPGVKPYVLLRQALERAGKVALVKVALRNRESLAALRVREGALVVQTMLWPDEIREASTYAPGDDVVVRDQEVAMAESYIETLSEDFDPSVFSDGYRAALEELVTAKAGGRQLAEPAEAAGGSSGTVVDLMAALRASVDAARQRRESGGADQEEREDGRARESQPSGVAVPKIGAVAAAARRGGETAPRARKTAPTGTSAAKASAAKTSASKTAPAKASAAKTGAAKAPGKGAAKASTGKPAAKTASRPAAKTASQPAAKAAAKKSPARKSA